MENPNSWGQAETLIAEAIAAHQRALEAHISGVSLPMRIAHALRNVGLLRDNPAAAVGEAGEVDQ